MVDVETTVLTLHAMIKSGVITKKDIEKVNQWIDDLTGDEWCEFCNEVKKKYPGLS